MKKGDQYKYGEGVSKNATPETFDDRECCKGFPGFRTDYSETMEPHRGSRTYPSVNLVFGRTMGNM